jgi:hypothetical protein
MTFKGSSTVVPVCTVLETCVIPWRKPCNNKSLECGVQFLAGPTLGGGGEKNIK